MSAGARIDITGMLAPLPCPDVAPTESPPSDAAAECALLAMCELYPALVGSLHGLGDLLVFPEHRAIWQAMCAVYLRLDHPDVAEFYIALREELCARVCPVNHRGSREQCDGFRYLRVLDFGEHANPKDIAYWLARLDRVRVCRQIISDAQEQAEKAWRLDVEGAVRVAVRVCTRGQSVVRVDIV